MWSRVEDDGQANVRQRVGQCLGLREREVWVARRNRKLDRRDQLSGCRHGRELLRDRQQPRRELAIEIGEAVRVGVREQTDERARLRVESVDVDLQVLERVELLLDPAELFEQRLSIRAFGQRCHDRARDRPAHQRCDVVLAKPRSTRSAVSSPGTASSPGRQTAQWRRRVRHAEQIAAARRGAERCSPRPRRLRVRLDSRARRACATVACVTAAAAASVREVSSPSPNPG